MKENKINIAELLKDCPKGMELDCILFNNPVKYDDIDIDDTYPIKILTENDESFYFTKEGYLYNVPNSKCLIFPKGKTTWEGFHKPFKDGDIVAFDAHHLQIFIFKDKKENNTLSNCYLMLDVEDDELYLEDSMYYVTRFATEEEKQKLFDAIKANGYKWNAETKTLEKLTIPSTPEKFYIRIGEIPSEEKSAVHRGDVVVGYEDGVSVYDCVETDGLYRIVMPFPLKEGQGMTYECLIQEITQCRYEIKNPRNVYLVSGIEVGKGSDNEPVIKNVKILKDLTEQFNTKNDNTEETKTLEKLEQTWTIQDAKDGDVLAFDDETIVIFKDLYNNTSFHSYCHIEDGIFTISKEDMPDWWRTKGFYPATEEQCTLLFRKIKEAGYHWNADSKTLEELPKPKFKVGDRIIKRDSIVKSWIVSSVGSEYYGLKSRNNSERVGVMSIAEQDNCELELVLTKFDITTLKPFDKVMVRDIDTHNWIGAFYSHYNPNGKKFYIMGGSYYFQCIPYEENKHLLETSNDCDEYFKTW